MVLRKLQDKDYEYMKEWMNDEEITSNFRTDFKNIKENEIRKFIQNSYTEVNINLAVVNVMDEYMGTISLKNINHTDKNGEYAIVLRKKAIGTGLATLATEELLRISFCELGLNRVYLNVYSENLRAIKFYEKVGFKYEGEFKKHICVNNVFKNLMWFAILKEEYKLNEI
ncbi:MAG: GNAT family protein [Sedimentibacter saalensis]|uniref:GNAT family N-acetyltransferase n=1 Tax=Sedimentibacter saalensis TaxID=130788 RepID=UPI0031594D47